MKTKDLNDDISTASLLSTVYNQMLNWDLEPLSGEAFYNKTRSKAYIKIYIKHLMMISQEVKLYGMLMTR